MENFVPDFSIANYATFPLHEDEKGNLRKCHEMMVDMHGQFLKNTRLQELLFPEQTYDYDKEEPRYLTSYLSILPVAVRGRFNAGYLMLADMLYKASTKEPIILPARESIIPAPAVADTKTIILEAAEDPEISSLGISLEMHYDLYISWMEADISSKKIVTDYMKALWNTHHHFFMQTLNMAFFNNLSHRSLAKIDEEDIGVKGFFNNDFTHKQQTGLDNVYYNRAMQSMREITPFYDKVSQDKLGKRFIPNKEEEAKIQKMVV